jgi:hypothetical protein
MGHQPDKAIHYMEEAQALADHVCVMSKGEITATGTQEAWRAEAGVGGAVPVGRSTRQRSVVAAGAGLGRAGSAYSGSVLIGLLIVLLDVAAISGLIAAIVVTARRLRHRPLGRYGAGRRWIGLVALSATLALIVVGDVWFLTSSYNQGRPSTAQIAGTWADSSGAKLRVLPDGTFTAAGLPTDANDPAGDGKPHPADGHGTWQVTWDDGAWSVLFTLTGHSQFQLVPAHFAKPGGTSAAMFSYVFARYNAGNIWAFYRQ